MDEDHEHFEFELPLVIGALIDRLFRIGHTEAATALERGWVPVREGSNDWRPVLQAVQLVRSEWASNLAEVDQDCLRNIEADVRAGMLRLAAEALCRMSVRGSA
ncbi:MAG TPA: hypothetical protein VGG39_37770 [Polyangiaceae bacterium]|jgi:hypothetical protein